MCARARNALNAIIISHYFVACFFLLRMAKKSFLYCVCVLCMQIFQQVDHFLVGVFLSFLKCAHDLTKFHFTSSIPFIKVTPCEYNGEKIVSLYLRRLIFNNGKLKSKYIYIYFYQLTRFQVVSEQKNTIYRRHRKKDKYASQALIHECFI